MRTPTGHYLHLGTSLAWDEHGLTLRRPDAVVVHVPWDDVHGARSVNPGPTTVEILVERSSQAPAALESLALPVNSPDDAARLLTTINWHSGSRRAGSRPGWFPRRWRRR